jgi:hypothetical protein
VKGIHRGGERGTDAAHRVVHPLAASLPWIEPSQEGGSGGQHRRMAITVSSIGGNSGGGG